MNLMTITGASLRNYRQQRGLSQARLAELVDIPQHLLSAYELGKIDLPSSKLESMLVTLADERRVQSVTTRAKRYRKHTYVRIQRLEDRLQRATLSRGNPDYLDVLRRISDGHKGGGTRKSFSSLSLFSGCGGFSLGFSAAGFAVKGFLEIDPGLRDIYKANFPSSSEIGGDITAVSEAALAQLSEQAGDIDVIIGGPPCQGFSLSGKRSVEDPRNQLFRHYLRFVDRFSPKVALLENVRLLSSMKSPTGGYVKDDICREFRKRNYKVTPFELNAKDFGVPQHRERIIFVAVRNDLGIVPSLPPTTHGTGNDLFSALAPCRTFADACSDLPYIESGETSDDALHSAVNHPEHVINWLWDVAEGCSAHENEDPSKRPPSGYNTTYKRQHWGEPAATVQTTFGMISGCRNVHPIATRSLTVREAARIQSFPDSYQFPGNLGTVRRGIGNAVPPLLAFSLGLRVKELLMSHRSNRLSG